MRFITLLPVIIGLFFSLYVQAENTQLPARIQSGLDYAKVPTSAVSLLVESLEDGEVLVNVNPDISRNPASVIKVITSYSALEILGPGYSWPTELYLRGELQSGGRVEGRSGYKGLWRPLYGHGRSVETDS